MVLPQLAAAVGIGYLLKRLAETDADHDDVVEEAYQVVDRESGESASIYVDHIQDRHGVDATDTTHNAKPRDKHRPDLVVSRFAGQSLTIEVETDGTLDDDAREQLVDFAQEGYKRVLVVPDGALDDGVSFLEDFADGDDIAVCEPQDLTQFL
jgi:hypothetical protein